MNCVTPHNFIEKEKKNQIDVFKHDFNNKKKKLNSLLKA